MDALKVLIVSLTISSFLGVCLCTDCTGEVDGLYEASCQTAIKCVNETAVHLECLQPKVINEDTWECDDALNVTTPCGTYRECSIKDDGGYPEVDFDCHWYFICSSGFIYGHGKCASGLVWNSDLQTCDYSRNVVPPCGTYTEE